MNIKRITTKAMEAIMMNEIGGNLALAYKFSDPDGVNNGKSGYSFGRVQMDTENNFGAIECLKSCGFTIYEVVGLIKQNIDIEPMNRKLAVNKDVVDRYDYSHVHLAAKHCEAMVFGYAVKVADALEAAVMVHIMDYHNQFYLSPGGKMHKWLQAQNKPVTPDDILQFKLDNTLWGKKRPDDVKRRWRNIQKIMGV